MQFFIVGSLRSHSDLALRVHQSANVAIASEEEMRHHRRCESVATTAVVRHPIVLVEHCFVLVIMRDRKENPLDASTLTLVRKGKEFPFLCV